MAKDHYSATPSSPSSVAIATSQPALCSWRPTTAQACDADSRAARLNGGNINSSDDVDAFMRPVRSCKQRDKLTRATYRPATCGIRQARVAAEAATIASALDKNEKLSALALTSAAAAPALPEKMQPAHPRTLQPAMAYWTTSYVTRDGRTVAEAKLTPPYWPVKQHIPFARLTNGEDNNSATAAMNTRLLLLPPIAATSQADKFAPPPQTLANRVAGVEQKQLRPATTMSSDAELNPIFLYRAITSSIEADASAKGLQVCQIRYYDEEFGTFVLLTPKSVLHSVACSSYVVTVETSAAEDKVRAMTGAQPSLQTLLPSAAELGRMPYGNTALLEQPSCANTRKTPRRTRNNEEEEEEAEDESGAKAQVGQKSLQLLQEDITAALLQLDELQQDKSEDAAQRRAELLRRIGRNESNSLVVSAQYSRMANTTGNATSEAESDSFRAAIAQVESERSAFFTEAELKRFIAQQLRVLQAQVSDLITAEYVSRETIIHKEHTDYVLCSTAQRESHAAACQATEERLQREAIERQRAYEAAVAALEVNEAVRRNFHDYNESISWLLCTTLANASREKTGQYEEHTAAVQAEADIALERITVLRVEENLARVLAEREAEKRAVHAAAVERLCAQEEAARYVMEDFEWAAIDSLLFTHGVELIALQEAEQRALHVDGTEARERMTLEDEAQGSFLLACQRTARRKAAEAAAWRELCDRIEHLSLREVAARTAVEYGEEDTRAMLQRVQEAELNALCEATALRDAQKEPCPMTDIARIAVVPAIDPQHEATESTQVTLTPEALIANRMTNATPVSLSAQDSSATPQSQQPQEGQQQQQASTVETTTTTTPSSELVPSAPQSSDASETVSAAACTITSVTVILAVADGAAPQELRAQLPAAIKEDILCCLGDAVQQVELSRTGAHDIAAPSNSTITAPAEGSIIHLNVTHDGRYSDESMQQAISRYTFPCLMQLYQRARLATPTDTTTTTTTTTPNTENNVTNYVPREAGIATCAVVTPPQTPGLPQVHSEANSEATASQGELVQQEQNTITHSDEAPHVDNVNTESKAVEEQNDVQMKDDKNNEEEEVKEGKPAGEATNAAADEVPVSLGDTARPEDTTRGSVDEEEQVSGDNAEEHEDTIIDDDVDKTHAPHYETIVNEEEEVSVRPATPPAPSKMLQAIDALPAFSYAEHYTQMEHEPTVQPPEYGKEGQGSAQKDTTGSKEEEKEEEEEELVCTEHYKQLEGEHWALVKENYRHVFAKEFVEDLVELLHCDPSCVRSVRLVVEEEDGNNEAQIDFTFAHSPQLRQAALDELIARFDFPRLQQLHDCVHVIIDDSPTKSEAKKKEEDVKSEKDVQEPHETERAVLRSATLSVLSQASLRTRSASLRESEHDSVSRPSTGARVEFVECSSEKADHETNDKEEEEEEVHVMMVEATTPEEEGEVKEDAEAEEEDDDDATTATTTKESLPDIVVAAAAAPPSTASNTIATTTTNTEAVEVSRRPFSGGSASTATRVQTPDWAALWRDSGSPIPGYEWERSGSTPALDKAPHLTSHEVMHHQHHGRVSSNNSVELSGADSPEARKLFIDFTSKHRALAAVECGRRNCGLRQPVVSHHRVQLSGEDWSAVLRHAARFLRDQFIGEVSECLSCSPECVRNVVLRCSRHRGLLVDCDILHEVTCTNEEVNRCLQGHHFTLLRELYNSRDELADINVDALLEDDIHLCAYEAEAGSSSLSLYRMSRNSQRSGSESKAVQQPTSSSFASHGATAGRERGSRSSILRFLTRHRGSARSMTQTDESLAVAPQNNNNNNNSSVDSVKETAQVNMVNTNEGRTSRKASASRARGSSLQLPPLIPRTASGSQLPHTLRKPSNDLTPLVAAPPPLGSRSSRSSTPREVVPAETLVQRPARLSGLLPPLTQSPYPTEANQ